jgi:hypothetical protein
MMHILKEIGIPIYYSEKREEKLLKNDINNPYFYEDENCIRGKIEYEKLKNHAVKIFAKGAKKIELNRNETKVIYMHRTITYPFRNVRRDIKDIKDKEKKKGINRGFFFKGPYREDDMNDFVSLYYKYNMIIINYDSLIDNTEKEIVRLKEFLDLEFDVDFICNLVDPDLRHTLIDQRSKIEFGF